MSYTVNDKHIITLNGKEILFPRDLNYETSTVIYGIDIPNGKLMPIEITENGRLKVDAQLEITDVSIGAVEIKDAITEAKINIINENADVLSTINGFAIFGSDGSKFKFFNLKEINNTYALVSSSYVLDASGKIVNSATNEKLDELKNVLTFMADGGFSFYNIKNNIIPDTITTLIEYIPTTKVQLSRFFVTGTADAKFTLEINDNPIMDVRNNITERNVNISFVGSELKLNANNKICIKVLHWAHSPQEFSGTIFMKERF